MNIHEPRAHVAAAFVDYKQDLNQRRHFTVDDYTQVFGVARLDGLIADICRKFIKQ